MATLNPVQIAIQRQRIAQVLEERTRIAAALASSPLVRKVWPSDANFLLVDFVDAQSALNLARAAKLLIRDMRTVSPHSLRISVGTPEQNDRLIRSLS
jgi:histidinol-phosphate/aromatic aminotransferase/cobyric acid decarboxylase-like protein